MALPVAQQSQHLQRGKHPWRSGKGDVVQEYVTAFPSQGAAAWALLLDLGFDPEHGSNGALSASQMQ